MTWWRKKPSAIPTPSSKRERSRFQEQFEAQEYRYLNAYDPSDPGSYDSPCVIVAGARGSGKSSLLLWRYVAPAIDAKVFQLWHDPSRDLAQKACGYALHRGHKRTLLIDDLASVSCGLGMPILRVSQLEGPERDAENDAFAADFADALCRMTTGDPDQLVTVDQYATLSANVVQYQRDPVDPWMVFHVLDTTSRHWRQLRDGCTRPDLVEKLDRLAFMQVKSPTEYLKNVQATQRRMDRLSRSPSLMARQWDATALFRESIQAGGLVIYEWDKSGRVDPRIQRFIILTARRLFSREWARMWVANGYPTPGQFGGDEDFSNRMVGQVEIDSCLEQRKQGLNWIFAGPSVETGSPELNEQLWSVCDEQIAMRQNSYDSAKTFVYNRMDIAPDRVKRERFTTRREIVDYEPFVYKTKGKTKGKDGGRESESEQVHWRPKLGDITQPEQPELKSYDDQIKEDISRLMRLPRGDYLLKSYNEISGTHHLELGEDVTHDQSAALTAEHFQWLCSNLYQRPDPRAFDHAGVSSGASNPTVPAHGRSRKKKS